MIKLELGDEPDELAQQRRSRIPAAIAAINRHGVDSKLFKDLLDSGYQTVKTELRKRQYGKCAYCEKSEDLFGRPVEHFRPKKEAHNWEGNQWVSVVTHYWWLAWSWENLYFTCDKCNKKDSKGSKFPIREGHQRIGYPPHPVQDPLPDEFFDTAAEHRLLIDPRIDQPLSHIQWMPVNRTDPIASWAWTVEGLDEMGDVTIKVLGLLGRCDEVTTHLRSLLEHWRQVELHLAGGRPLEAQNSWSAMVDIFVDDPRQPFRSAAWWALNSLCPREMRAEVGFPDPPIPAASFRA